MSNRTIELASNRHSNLTRFISILLVTTLVAVTLLISGCGRDESETSEIERLTAENTALQTRVAQVEGKNTTLTILTIALPLVVLIFGIGVGSKARKASERIEMKGE